MELLFIKPSVIQTGQIVMEGNKVNFFILLFALCNVPADADDPFHFAVF